MSRRDPPYCDLSPLATDVERLALDAERAGAALLLEGPGPLPYLRRTLTTNNVAP